MDYQAIFQRHEIKYLISKEQKKQLLSDMDAYMKQDDYGQSTICNLYFDTENYRLIRRSMEGPVYKEKFRLRSYGVAKPDSTVFLELKKKYRSIVYKRRVSITEADANEYLLHNEPVLKDSQIMEEIDYFRNFYQGLHPAVFLSYDREAFYGKSDPGFRVTFDQNILWRDTGLSLRKGPYGSPLLESGQALMELKAAEALPLWMVQLLSKHQIRQTSFSKYGRAYQEISAAAKNNGGIRYA